ncbi:D-2-hydroxyacid dehydrogenase [Shewanella salipaludis]|uniref:D-2-hydroxyacid dehydrogenase n=1 Tax=Shewanella salipaludis TaxID=2723052 RepID=A0A972JLC8_9GAMM|nr:D-2-hydroxyacid dehydrogenase [Shewanella salipaludis]NMH65302.1 D-2-hydroxyacid dehydrogenase [Shewanella salipaludis]
MRHKLLLLTRENSRYRQLLAASPLPGLTLLGDDPLSIQEADIWLAEPALAAPLLAHARDLRWLQSTFAGVDALTKPRQRRDYQLTNIRGIFGPLMSEYLFGYLLAHQREHLRYKSQQQLRQWLPGSYKTLQGQTLLLLGTGSIARHIAQTAKHFGMRVVGLNRSATQVPEFDEIATLDALPQYLPQADAIASLLPSTPETRGRLNAIMLALLKPDAVLFNLGRGDVLDLDALNLQLAANPEQQAILDVFNQEPLPAEHPIWERTNATITPHIAAPSFPEQVVDIFTANYHKLLAGQPLAHRVDFERGY